MCFVIVAIFKMRSKWVCHRRPEVLHYKGVKVWLLPEIQWGHEQMHALLRECGELKSVGNHGFDKDTQQLIVLVGGRHQ
jgi:hypothetical protein